MVEPGITICSAHNRDGSPCSRPAENNTRVCRQHGAAGGAPTGNTNRLVHGIYSPRVQTRAMLQLQAIRLQIAALRLSESPGRPPLSETQRQQIRQVLDKASQDIRNITKQTP